MDLENESCDDLVTIDQIHENDLLEGVEPISQSEVFPGFNKNGGFKNNFKVGKEKASKELLTNEVTCHRWLTLSAESNIFSRKSYKFHRYICYRLCQLNLLGNEQRLAHPRDDPVTAVELDMCLILLQNQPSINKFYLEFCKFTCIINLENSSNLGK